MCRGASHTQTLIEEIVAMPSWSVRKISCTHVEAEEVRCLDFREINGQRKGVSVVIPLTRQ